MQSDPTTPPKRIWADPPETFDGMDIWRSEPGGRGVEYILASEHAALIREAEALAATYWKLRSYAVHDDGCKINKPPYSIGSCSCGLTAALVAGEAAAIRAAKTTP